MDTPARPALALDFDGVICDGRDEALVAAFNAFNRYRGLSWWVDEPAGLDPRLVDRFLSLSRLVRPAREYWLIMNWLEDRADDLDPKEFERQRELHGARLNDFESTFFAVREEMRTTDPEAWTELHRFQREASIDWEQLNRKNEVFLISSRDLASTRHLCEAWSLGLDDANLLTRERVESKTAAIPLITDRLGIKAIDVLFVDDHPGNLAAMAEAGARCLWAEWGYHRLGFDTAGFDSAANLRACTGRLLGNCLS